MMNDHENKGIIYPFWGTESRITEEEIDTLQWPWDSTHCTNVHVIKAAGKEEREKGDRKR